MSVPFLPVWTYPAKNVRVNQSKSTLQGSEPKYKPHTQYFRYTFFCICPHERQIFWSEGSANTEYTRTQQDTSKKELSKEEDDDYISPK